MTGAAYTNNDLAAATATTLFDVDTALDQISVQSPANAGNLAPTGKLGVDAGPRAGFDIYTSTRSGSNTAYAVLRVDGKQRMYRADLLNGSVARTGSAKKPETLRHPQSSRDAHTADRGVSSGSAPGHADIASAPD